MYARLPVPEAAGDTLSNLAAESRQGHQDLAEGPSLFIGVNPRAEDLRLTFYTHWGISPSSDSCKAVPAMHYSKAIKLFFRVESLRLFVVLNDKIGFTSM